MGNFARRRRRNSAQILALWRGLGCGLGQGMADAGGGDAKTGQKIAFGEIHAVLPDLLLLRPAWRKPGPRKSKNARRFPGGRLFQMTI
jgi:hypothetical protein